MDDSSSTPKEMDPMTSYTTLSGYISSTMTTTPPTTSRTTRTTRFSTKSPSAIYHEWGEFNLAVPITICILVVILLIITVIIAKKRRGRLRREGRQHPSRVMSGGPAMNVEAFRNYPGTVPHSQRSAGQGPQRNEVALVVDPEPTPRYPGQREPPPSYDEVMRLSSRQQLGNANLGYSHTNENEQPGGSTSQPSCSMPPGGSSEQPQNNQNEAITPTQEGSNNIINTSGNSGNSNGSQIDGDEKLEPEISVNSTDPKPD